MFNSTLMSDLIKQAQGNRSLSKFARECGVSPSTLSRIINCVNNQSAKPETLKKIANHAQNNVTYDLLMAAAGYNSSDNSEQIESIETKTLINIDELVTEIIENPSSVILHGKPLSDDAVNNLIEALKFGIKYAEVKDKLINNK